MISCPPSQYFELIHPKALELEAFAMILPTFPSLDASLATSQMARFLQALSKVSLIYVTFLSTLSFYLLHHRKHEEIPQTLSRKQELPPSVLVLYSVQIHYKV